MLKPPPDGEVTEYMWSLFDFITLDQLITPTTNWILMVGDVN